MWFADIGLGLAGGLLVGWVLVVVTATVGHTVVGSVLAVQARLDVRDRVGPRPSPLPVAGELEAGRG